MPGGRPPPRTQQVPRPHAAKSIQDIVNHQAAIKLPHISREQAAECLNKALDLGINFIDTSRGYSDSETKIGHALKARRREYYLATKTDGRDYDSAMAELETSLRELQTDYLDLWQLHSISNKDRWRQVTAPDGAVKALHKVREEGVARHVGITIHRDLDVMKEAIASGEFETIMLVYNPLDSENVAGILPLAKQQGMGTIIMKALSGGQIAYPKQARRAGLGGPDALVAGALRWVLSDENVDCVIPGMQAVHEVEENFALINPFVPITDDERREFIARLGELRGEYRYGQRCLSCGYCQPCPQGVNIPVILHAATIVQSYPDDLKYLGYQMYRELQVGAEACIQCGQCLEECPAELPIPDLLSEAAKLLAS